MFYNNNFASITPRLTIATLLLSASVASAAVVNYDWIGGNGDWELSGNWSPAPADIIASDASTALDRVTIGGDVTVTRTGDLFFMGAGTGGNNAGTFNAITLRDGANLDVTGNLRVTSVSGSPNAANRHVLIDTGSSLNVSGSIAAGHQNSSTNSSTWTIRGSVTANSFLGMKSTSSSTGITGGFILNIDGGNFAVADTFNFKYTGGNLPDLIGRINISDGGVFSVGSFVNLSGSTENYINFVDGSGTFSVGRAQWSTVGEIEALIQSGFIRKDGDVSGNFNILDKGATWEITVIPEPSAYAFIALGAGAALLLRKKVMLRQE